MSNENLDLEKLSADDIMALYRKKLAEEEQKEQEAKNQQIKELQAQRQDIVTEYKKKLAEIDKQIKKLGGKTSSTAGKKRSGSGKDSISSQILDMLKSNGRMSAKAIKETLESAGHEVKYLHQRLAHLKRTNQVKTPERGFYELG